MRRMLHHGSCNKSKARMYVCMYVCIYIYIYIYICPSVCVCMCVYEIDAR